MIEQNVAALLQELSRGNSRGEPVIPVAATKTRTPEEINRAITAGIRDVGENRAQEFRDKYDAIKGARRHFIGHIQLNKLKYLVGKVDLYHSIDRDELAEALSALSLRRGVTSELLIQINIGNEENKGGYPLDGAEDAYRRIQLLPALRVRGLMAMLPASGEEGALAEELCEKMRACYDALRAKDGNINFLSMGMSGDWRLCIAHGANMIRLGTAIFGERPTPPKQD